MAILQVNYSRQGDRHQIETGNAALGTIIINNEGIPAEARGGTAKQLLASSALFCYCSALVTALETRAINFENLKATATLETGNNDKGQGRVKKISIAVSVQIDEDDLDTFDRIQKIMKQGCLVTGSLHEGIEMEYNLTAECED